MLSTGSRAGSGAPPEGPKGPVTWDFEFQGLENWGVGGGGVSGLKGFEGLQQTQHVFELLVLMRFQGLCFLALCFRS